MQVLLSGSTHAHFPKTTTLTNRSGETAGAANSMRFHGRLTATDLTSRSEYIVGMAKYSTGRSGGGGDGGSCELCGSESAKLRRANVAGAELLVCKSCAPHGENRNKNQSRNNSNTNQQQDQGTDRPDSERSRKKRAVQRAAKMYDAGKGDPTHWEKEVTNYERDRLPYLISGYGEVVETARQDAGYTLEGLAETLDVSEKDLLAVEQGRATRAGVGGSVIRAIEDELEIALVDE